MMSEMAEKSYQAVRCTYCSEPIPLSPRLLALFVVESESTKGGLQTQSEVLTLRCGACSKERRYLKSEIENLECDPPEDVEVNRAAPKRYAKALRKAAGE
jgi:hypothetical protein